MNEEYDKFQDATYWNNIGFGGLPAALAEMATQIRLAIETIDTSEIDRDVVAEAGGIMWDQVIWPGTAEMLRRKPELD